MTVGVHDGALLQKGGLGCPPFFETTPFQNNLLQQRNHRLPFLIDCGIGRDDHVTFSGI